jgi:CHASE2 domain-containing sensor protein
VEATEIGRAARVSLSGRKIFKATVVVALAIAGTYIASHVGFVPDFEVIALDTQMRLNQPPNKTDVVIVCITDSDYKQYFGEQSPLKPDGVQRVIAAIAKGGPKVIGVDLDTSGPEYQNFNIQSDWPKIIWAREAREVKKGKLQPLSVMGGRSPAPCSGLVAIKSDRDKVVRHYLRAYAEKEMFSPQVCENSQHEEDTAGVENDCSKSICPLPSMPWAMIKEFLPDDDFKRLEKERDISQELTIRLARARSKSPEQPIQPHDCLTVQEVLDVYENTDPKIENEAALLFKDKMVLLGGSYSAARDAHETPLGTMTGVEILAQIIETEMSGGGFPPPNLPVTAFLLVIENFVLVLILHHFREKLWGALIACFIAIPFMALLCSFLVFRSFILWVYFIPILLIVLIHELYDIAQDRRKEAITDTYESIIEALSREPAQPANPEREGISESVAANIALLQNEGNSSLPKSKHSVIGAALLAAIFVLMMFGSASAKKNDKL